MVLPCTKAETTGRRQLWVPWGCLCFWTSRSPVFAMVYGDFQTWIFTILPTDDLPQSSHFENITSTQLRPSKNSGFICALSTAGFHHNVCGQLHDSWFRPFSQPQKPPKGLQMNISCSHVYCCGELGDAIPLQIFFQLWLSQTTQKTASHIRSVG